MNTSLFEFQSYKKYVLHYLKNAPLQGRGLNIKIAKALYCQPAYISQVLKSYNHFTPEQAVLLADFLELSEKEKQYFIWLVEYERAGNSQAKKYFFSQMALIREESLEMKNTLQINTELPEIQKAQYFSHWSIPAIHIHLSIEKINTVELLSKKLKLPTNLIKENLDFLIKCDLVYLKEGHYYSKNHLVFIDKNSPFFPQHHSQWRLKSIENLSQKNKKDIHLSLLYSLSSSDYEILRSMISHYIQNITGIVKKSKEEKAVCFNLDFFEI